MTDKKVIIPAAKIVLKNFRNWESFPVSFIQSIRR